MIILFGLAGSGKGTQGKALSEIFGWRTISVGQAIRDAGTYEDIISKGNLAPDDDVIALMNTYIERADDEGYDLILDGYPRDAYQARWVVDNIRDKIDGAIILEVPKDELYKRLELRSEFEGRSDDKKRETINHRFEIFEKNIDEILPIFEEAGLKVLKVNGVGEVGTVTGRLIAAVRELNPDATKQVDDVNGGEIEKSYGE